MQPSVCTRCGCRLFEPAEIAQTYRCLSCETIFMVRPVQCDWHTDDETLNAPGNAIGANGHMLNIFTEEEEGGLQDV